MTVNLAPATITDQLLSATDGITVAATAGVVPLPNAGYVVGGVVPALAVLSPVALDGLPESARTRELDDLRSRVAGWVTEHLQLVAATAGYRFGAWVNPADGVLWLDVVEIVHEADKAVRLGRERGEIAVWDIRNGVDILTS